MKKYELHLIASKPSHGDVHVDPVKPKLLKRYATLAEAKLAGRLYLARHPKAWLQVDDGTGHDIQDIRLER